MISVIVIDESKMIRKRIQRLLESDRRIVVTGSAGSGEEGFEMAAALRPDVITLDLELFQNKENRIIEKLRQALRIPTIIIGSVGREKAFRNLEKLIDNNTDFILKPFMTNTREVDNFRRDLILKVRSAALKNLPNNTPPSKTIKRKPRQNCLSSEPARRHFIHPAIALGISTGGPKKLLKILPKIPSDFPAPIFLTQHMPPGFTSSLANRLDQLSRIKVKEARNGEKVKRSVCYIAPGDQHLTTVTTPLSRNVMIRVSRFPEDVIYRPSVDIMMESVARVYGSDTIGIVMTGMGADGTRGMREIRRRAGVTIAEEASTCTVYGMPRSVIESGLADIITPDNELISILIQLLTV